MNSGEQFYSEEEAQEILNLASKNQGSRDLSRDQLIEKAAELGLSPAAIADAEAEYASRRQERMAAKQDLEARVAFREKYRSQFMGHLAIFAAVNLFLIAIWAKTGGMFWPMFPIGGWSIGMVGHALPLFNQAAFDSAYKSSHASESLRGELLTQISAGRAPAGHIDSRYHEYLLKYVSAGGNSKVEAIREVRQAFGVDLKDAKDVVDGFQKELPGVLN